MKTKVCTKCKQRKSLSEFGKSKNTKDGLTYRCLQCKRKYEKKYRETAMGIYTSIKGRQKFYKDNENKVKPFLISAEDFITWYNNEPKTCAYCDIKEEEISLIKDNYNKQSERLSIDCMDNGLGYVNGNLVLACRRCNSIKSDLLTYKEMREFAQKYIKPKHLNRQQLPANKL